MVAVGCSEGDPAGGDELCGEVAEAALIHLQFANQFHLECSFLAVAELEEPKEQARIFVDHGRRDRGFPRVLRLQKILESRIVRLRPDVFRIAQDRSIPKVRRCIPARMYRRVPNSELFRAFGWGVTNQASEAPHFRTLPPGHVLSLSNLTNAPSTDPSSPEPPPARSPGKDRSRAKPDNLSDFSPLAA